MAAKSILEIILTAKDQASHVLGGVGKALGTIGGAALAAGTVGLAAAAGGLVAVGGGLATLAKDAAELGPITEAFKNLTEASGESSDEMIKALRRQSGYLITDEELMKNYNQAAQLVGDQFANQLPGAMEYLGKISASTGDDIGFLMSSLVTGIGRLSPMILDNLKIQVDLTQAYEDYAATLGKSASELTKPEQQAALMNQVMSKLADNTKDLAAVKDPFKQIGVSITNAKDSLAAAIGPVILPLIQSLADQLTTFVTSDQFQQWIKDIADWLQSNLIPVLERFVEWASTEAPVMLANLSNWFTNEFLPAAQSAWSWMNSTLFPTLQDLGRFISDVWGIMEHGKPIIDAFIGGWKLIFGAIDAVIKHVQLMISNWQDTYNILSKLGDSLPDWLKPGSPTPLELGLRGITSAMSALNRQGLPQAQIGLAGGMGASGIAGGGVVINLTYSTGMTLGTRSELEAQLVPVLDNALRRYNRGKVR